MPIQSKGQPVLGAQNTALGGGGTAYLTGVEATLWNPGNLTIQDRHGQWHIGLGHIGILYEPVLSNDVAGEQFLNFTDVYYPYKANSAVISQNQRESILERNYPSDRQIVQHQTRADIFLGGALWQRGDEAYSITARARFASRIEVGRGWYSNNFSDSGSGEIRDMSLTQQRNHLYELSLGYAREFTLVNGLLPQINQLHVGIAPKFVMAGPSINLSYDSRYIRSNDGSNERFVNNFSYLSTGSYSKATLAYQAGANPQEAINNNFNRQLRLNNTGYGAGVDFGFTYVIPLGDDLSIIDNQADESVLSKSVRIALSVNDIGFIRYDESPLQFSMPADTIITNQQAPAESMFTGADGQYLQYFESATDLPNPILSEETPNQNSYTTLLPTSVNAGILFEYPNLKLMSDLTLGLNNTAFTTTKLAFHLGVEARPLSQLPIRLGTRIASGLPTQLGLGTGIETKHWDFNIGTQILIRSRTFTSEFVGGAFAGIQLHL